LSGNNYTFFEQVSRTIRKLVPTANISWSPGNLHEYPGINTIWFYGPKYDIAGYSHCRGLTHGKTEVDAVFEVVIKPWREVLEIFRNNHKVNRIGFLSSIYGWAWFNFWLARGPSLRNNP
jgi:hypothetical protein